MVKSKVWRATDVQGRAPFRLTIAEVTEETMGRGGRQEVKCFLWFQEDLKGLQLNRSRVALLEHAFGPDSEMWVGKRVRLSYDPTVIFAGRAVGGVKLETPPGVVFDPAMLIPDGWGSAQGSAPGTLARPPAPIWDEQRQAWITPAPIARPAASASRPPPPVFNELTGQWETMDVGSGEIRPLSPPQQARAPTISERVNAQHPVAGVGAQDGWGSLPPQGQTDEDAEFGHSDIPF